MGPLANTRRMEAIEGYIADAVKCGAKITTGGKRIGNVGNFFEPTVLTDVPLEARMMNEEPFGPLALVAPFSSTEDAIAKANRLEFGLASYAFSGSSRTIAEVTDGIEAGMVGVNSFAIAFPEAPFGGVKHSGFGSEGGVEGIGAYMRTKFVSRVEV